MTKLPDIIDIQSGDDECTINMLLQPELEWFKGHFPDTPVLPGVIQLDWAINLAKQHLYSHCSLTVQKMEVLKFQQLLLPNQHVTLNIKRKGDNKFVFSYTSALGQHSSGRIVFEVVS